MHLNDDEIRVIGDLFNHNHSDVWSQMSIGELMRYATDRGIVSEDAHEFAIKCLRLGIGEDELPRKSYVADFI